MQCALCIIYIVTTAESVQAIALTRVQLAGKLQAICHRTQLVKPALLPGSLEFAIEKTQIKGGVVNNHLGAGNKINKFHDNLGDNRFVCQEILGDAVHFQSPYIYTPFWINESMEPILGVAAIDDFHTADLYDPVTFPDLQAGGFSIEYD